MKQLILITILFTSYTLKAQSLFINEIMASNSTVAGDQNGEYADWIEIYNASANDIDLDQYYLSDDNSNLSKFQINGSLIVPANQVLIVWASGNTQTAVNHTSFSLSAGGEWIGIIAPDGVTVIDSFSFQRQKSDVSYGRKTNGDATLKYFSPSSFNAPNDSLNSYIGFLDAPVFSQKTGFYNQDFQLYITHEDPSVQILYSLDGSEPSVNALTPVSYGIKTLYPVDPYSPIYPLDSRTYQSFIYNNQGIPVSDPIAEPNQLSVITTSFIGGIYNPSTNIPKCRLVSAKAQKEGYLPSDQITQSYFFSADGSNNFNIPIVNIAVQPDKYWGYYQGIGVPGASFENWRATHPNDPANEYSDANYQLRGRQNEHPAYFSMMEDDSAVVEQMIGIRTHGGTSRSWRHKSIRLYARSEYGKNSISYPFFPDQNYSDFKTMLLHNSGQDFFTYYKEVSIHEAVKHLDFDMMPAKPVLTFLNSEIWGLYYLRTRYDNDYFNMVYGVDPDNLDITETLYANSSNMDEGDPIHINALLSYFSSHDMTTQSDYDYVATQLDYSNFIDYHLAEIFYGNIDWASGNNHGLWRNKTPYNAAAPKGQDGRWRYYLYDIDSGLSIAYLNHNNLIDATDANLDPTALFLRKLLLNPTFKNQFLNRFNDLWNSSFKSEYITEILNKNKQRIDHLIDIQNKRWGLPPSYNYWNNSSYYDVLTYVEQRPEIQYNQFKTFFNVGGTFFVNLSVNNPDGGFIKLNTLEVKPGTPGVSETPYPWSGEYFDSVPITLAAKPNLGFKFSHWLVNGNIVEDSVISVSTSTDISYQAFFEENILSDNPYPAAFALNNCGYRFDGWSSNSATGSFPISMAFVYMNQEDPLISAEIEGFTNGDYDYTSRTRINGLDQDGISFINTGSERPGYPATKLGGALLSIDTTPFDSLSLYFSAGTVKSNSREYNLRLQYRIGDLRPFQDFLDENGQPIEYKRASLDGDTEVFEAKLPEEIMGQPYVQLFWRYYYTGIRNDENSGARDEIRLDDISLKAKLKIDMPITATEIINQYGQIEAVNELSSTANVIFQAGSTIELKPGFTTSSGTIFTAVITGCD